MLNLSNIPDTLKRTNLNRAIKITFIVTLLIMALSFFYRLVIFPFQSQRNLGVCVLKAKQNYNEQWMTTCFSLFSAELIKEYGEDELCKSMVAENADPIEQNYQRQIDDCLNRYFDNQGK